MYSLFCHEINFIFVKIIDFSLRHAYARATINADVMGNCKEYWLQGEALPSYDLMIFFFPT